MTRVCLMVTASRATSQTAPGPMCAPADRRSPRPHGKELATTVPASRLVTGRSRPGSCLLRRAATDESGQVPRMPSFENAVPVMTKTKTKEQEKNAGSGSSSKAAPKEPIESPRLLLRRPRADDADAIFRRYAADAEVTRYL